MCMVRSTYSRAQSACQGEEAGCKECSQTCCMLQHGGRNDQLNISLTLKLDNSQALS